MVVLAPKSPFIDSVFKWVFPQDLLWLKEKGPLYQLWLDHFLWVTNQSECESWVACYQICFHLQPVFFSRVLFMGFFGLFSTLSFQSVQCL
jgi:hypothetical protein